LQCGVKGPVAFALGMYFEPSPGFSFFLAGEQE
jgi:hypothetical protein